MALDVEGVVGWVDPNFSVGGEVARTLFEILGGSEVVTAVAVLVGLVAFATPRRWILSPDERAKLPPDAHPLLRLVVVSSVGVISLVVIFFAPWGPFATSRRERDKSVEVARMMEASSAGRLDVVQALLAKGADVNARTTYGDGGTALISASSAGHLDVVQALLDKGANVNAKNSYGSTALMTASVNSHLDVVQALLAKGADVNAKMSDGTTALMGASSNGHLDVVQALLDKGANVNAKNRYGSTALMLTRNADVRTLLVQAGAKP